MKIDTNMLILLAAGGAALYFVTKDKNGGSGAGAISPADMAMMEQLANMQASAAANQEAMMQIIANAKQSSDPEKQTNPWTHPDTVMKFAQLGVDVAGMFI